MDTSTISLILNVILVGVALVLATASGYVFYRNRTPLTMAVAGCAEQLNAVRAELESSKIAGALEKKRLEEDREKERQKRVVLELEVADLRLQLRDARDLQRINTLAMNTVLKTAGIKQVEVPKPRKIILVGLWSEIPDMPKLDLKKDLDYVLRAGDWTYIPLVGNVSGKDLENELAIRNGADILYFATHADDEGVYLGGEKYSPAWVGEIAKTYGVKLVVLNACNTRETAYSVRSKGVPSVVYTLLPVGDHLAVEFAKSFFFALAIKKSVVLALESAQRSVAEFTDLNTKAVFGAYGDWLIGEEYL